MEPKDSTPLPNPDDVLAMSDDVLVDADQTMLRDRKYTLLNGMAFAWTPDSEQYATAARQLRLLAKVIVPMTKDDQS